MCVAGGFPRNGKPIEPTRGTVTMDYFRLVTSDPLRELAVCNDVVGGDLLAEDGEPRFPLPILMMLKAVRSTLGQCNKLYNSCS